MIIKRTKKLVTVRTAKGLNKALEARVTKIRVLDPLAKEFRKKRKRKNRTVAAGILGIVGGIAALPFTGGASAAGIAAGAAAMGLTMTTAALTITLSASELAIICGTTLALVGILKGAKVTLNPDGSVILGPKY